MSYHPSLTVTCLAERFLETVMKNEKHTPIHILQAVRNPGHPIVIDGVIITSQVVDWEEEDDPEDYLRSDYDSIVDQRDESIDNFIRPFGPMLLHLVDVDRKFRIDVRFYPIIHTKNGVCQSINVIGVDLLQSKLDSESERVIISWLHDRIENLDEVRASTQKQVKHLKLIVVNN